MAILLSIIRFMYTAVYDAESLYVQMVRRYDIDISHTPILKYDVRVIATHVPARARCRRFVCQGSVRQQADD